jgi:hypothetical protein
VSLANEQGESPATSVGRPASVAAVTTPPQGQRPDDERPPSWAGAPGFTPSMDGLPPHAPMPGAPPYPSARDHGPPPVGRPPRRMRFAVALGAVAVWAAVNLVLVLAVAGAPGSPRSFGSFIGALVVPTVLAALVVWAIARRRRWPFWLLVLVAAPIFWALRAALAAVPPS